MREILHNTLFRGAAQAPVGAPTFDFARLNQCQNFGLAYNMLAPPPIWEGNEPKSDDKARENWLEHCVEIGVSADYKDFFRLWQNSFLQASAETAVVALKARLLVGHGEASGSEVGLTVHHTWGAPIIPGSALKGLAAHYCDETYGPLDERWRGPRWEGNRIVAAPGVNYAKLFGAPDVDGPHDTLRRGAVEFHDALYVPLSTSGDRPFVRDVVTSHQKEYYKNAGACPSDWDNPVPVGFVTVKPGAKFLFAVTAIDGKTMRATKEVKPGAKFLIAVTGETDWRKLAFRIIGEALESWGVGGKTSAGYGRFEALPPRPPPGERVVGARVRDVNNRNRMGTVETAGTGHPKRWRIRWDDDPQPRSLQAGQFEVID